ncbi:class I SAM-dependent methyltransferase [Tengunoibacter tsumagoiensis]|uniref:Methyltransferase domain-containing protein n=1 Tax=Tengunoibacter tsumagoiensis TaxID=2014871 RepID=A0A402A9Y1_9CHLR|nr:class I SAM-dependent methyltransferase [Tengunoibacter tsumagoiensis]GCE15898.1 hypothetical protein KTT_57570 [Tengunoibacter tsumagoiensis]
MEHEELSNWFEAQKMLLQTSYMAAAQPWQQSGVGLNTPRSAQDWEVLRRPIADCITTSGSFLDIGCANGYLLECILNWTYERHLHIIPYGLDFSDQLVALARKRLSDYADHIVVGNAWNWSPPQKFAYVNTGLEYVPERLQKAYVQRCLDLYVQPGGYLLVTEYLGGRTGIPALRINDVLQQWGYTIEEVRESFLEYDPPARMRVAVIRNMHPKLTTGEPL